MSITYYFSSSNISYVFDAMISNGASGICESRFSSAQYSVTGNILTIQGAGVTEEYLICGSYLLSTANEYKGSGQYSDISSGNFSQGDTVYSFRKDGTFVTKTTGSGFSGKYIWNGAYIFTYSNTAQKQTFYYCNNAIYPVFLVAEVEKGAFTKKERDAYSKLSLLAEQSNVSGVNPSVTTQQRTPYKPEATARPSANTNKSSNSGLIWVIAIVLLLVAISSCNSETSDRNRVGSSIDWGPDHYWNSSTESVERIPWR